jgi:hypothetical protein
VCTSADKQAHTPIECMMHRTLVDIVVCKIVVHMMTRNLAYMLRHKFVVVLEFVECKKARTWVDKPVHKLIGCKIVDIVACIGECIVVAAVFVAEGREEVVVSVDSAGICYKKPEKSKFFIFNLTLMCTYEFLEILKICFLSCS